MARSAAARNRSPTASGCVMASRCRSATSRTSTRLSHRREESGFKVCGSRFRKGSCSNGEFQETDWGGVRTTSNMSLAKHQGPSRHQATDRVCMGSLLHVCILCVVAVGPAGELFGRCRPTGTRRDPVPTPTQCPFPTPTQCPHPKHRRGTRGMSRCSSCLTRVMDVE